LALYVYEDFSDKTLIERLLLWGVSVIRGLTVRIPKRWLFKLCQIASPLVYLFFTVPAKLLWKWTGTEPRIPFRHGSSPWTLGADLYDRFGAPVEFRYNKAHVQAWFQENGFSQITVAPLRGWAALGTKGQSV